MSEKKKEKNPFVQCIKCRNLWYAVGILSVVSILILGFVFLDFYHLINLIIVWDLVRYVGLIIIIVICGYASVKLFKEYCTVKRFAEYERDSNKLIGACITILIIVIGISVIGLYLPATFSEYEIREATTNEERIELIKGLSCSTFNASFNNWGSFFNEYRLYNWTPENGIEEIIYMLDVSDKDPRWLYNKKMECK